MKVKLFIYMIVILICVNTALAQSTAFTYQGKLTDAGLPATGNYDLQFRLFDTATVGTGTQQGATVTKASVAVTAGIFTVQLDFGAGVFSGAPRFLEIGVRQAGSPDPYTLLAPRQPITSTPYAIRSLNASVADTLSSACAGCVSSAQVGSVSGSAVTGTIPVASVPAGNASYVQNTTSPQAASNFNISGTGTANIFNAATQFNIGGKRILSTGSESLYAGENAGEQSTGTGNSFFGKSAGNSNTTGSDNAFFGHYAGRQNTGGFNSFFGSGAGETNAGGLGNAFFGYRAGNANVTGVNNAFFGYQAGAVNTASSNTFLGSQAGFGNTSGGFNTFIGTFAGNTNTTGSSNTVIGYNADVLFNNLSYATAIGAGAYVSDNNEVVVGRGEDTVRIRGILKGTIAEQAVTVSGVKFDLMSWTAGSTDVCWRSLSQNLAPCSSSLRYKTNVKTFNGGLDIVRRLRPITFNWKEGGKVDVGFAAEEVEQIEPLLTINNDKGEIEGVKYKQITTVLVNAVNEQQSQIENQQMQIDEQKKTIRRLRAEIDSLKRRQADIDALKRFICSKNPTAEICQEKQ